MLRKLIKSKTGDASIVEILFCIGIMTFMLFFPVITFSYFKLQNVTDGIVMDVVEAASVRGGVDESVIELLVHDLEENGYDFESNVINQGDGNGVNSIRVYTNVPLVTSYAIDNGHKINIGYINECFDGTTNITCNQNRRFRTQSDKDAQIKVRVVVPVSAHSRMINNLYSLISVKGGSTAVDKLDEQAGYVVTYSTLSELYDASTIKQ